MPFTLKNPPPPSGTLDDAKIIPDQTAHWFSKLTFNWISPLLDLGYARPLETTDLWKLDEWRTSDIYADRIIKSFDRRHAAAQDYNTRLASGDVKPAIHQRMYWTVRGNRAEREKKWREVDGKRKANLILAMNDAVKWYFWIGGELVVVAIPMTPHLSNYIFRVPQSH